MLLQERGQLLDVLEDLIERGVGLADVVGVVEARHDLHAVGAHAVEAVADLIEEEVVERLLAVLGDQDLAVDHGVAGGDDVVQLVVGEVAQVDELVEAALRVQITARGVVRGVVAVGVQGRRQGELHRAGDVVERAGEAGGAGVGGVGVGGVGGRVQGRRVGARVGGR